MAKKKNRKVTAEAVETVKTEAVETAEAEDEEVEAKEEEPVKDDKDKAVKATPKKETKKKGLGAAVKKNKGKIVLCALGGVVAAGAIYGLYKLFTGDEPDVVDTPDWGDLTAARNIEAGPAPSALAIEEKVSPAVTETIVDAVAETTTE